MTRSTKETKDESGDKNKVTSTSGYRSSGYSSLNPRDRSVDSANKYTGALSAKEKEPDKSAIASIKEKYSAGKNEPYLTLNKL